jgi:solute carrier family 44 protein 1 (choline transporter-like protein)
VLICEASGTLEAGTEVDGQFKATLRKNGLIHAAEIINVIAFLWFTQFLFGCQHFVIAGTISKWYFTRDKTKLHSPIQTTFTQLMSFHLGSVCMGSLVITIVKILKLMVRAAERAMAKSESAIGACLACCCVYLVEQLERLLKFLVRNAYIIVAHEGTPFVDSAKRAFNLILGNLMDIVALNQFGDLVLVFGRLFIVGIAGLFGYTIMVSLLGNVMIFRESRL